jgi:hypothetical protein
MLVLALVLFTVGGCTAFDFCFGVSRGRFHCHCLRASLPLFSMETAGSAELQLAFGL